MTIGTTNFILQTFFFKIIFYDLEAIKKFATSKNKLYLSKKKKKKILRIWIYMTEIGNRK